MTNGAGAERSGRGRFRGLFGRGHPGDSRGQQHVKGAVGTADDVADAPEILEEDLLRHQFAVLDFQAAKFLRGERRGEEVVLPLGKQATGIEVDPAELRPPQPAGPRLSLIHI